ncbi:MAG: CHAT domain-containing protein [Planctomycetes bacterium]|nr:CHAT domain-containing protein [Planctomycetota bacterium]
MTRITRLSDAFAALFEQPGRRPMVKPEALHFLGREMHDLWIAPVWRELESRLAPGNRTLVIRTTDATALNLPWELIELDGGGPLGCDPAWRLLRTPLDRLSPAAPARPGPLRVLFLAAAPTDQAQLDFEREEDAISTICGRVKDVVLRIVDSGTVDELRDFVTEFRPHIVHLSGHGIVGDDGVGRLAFEDEYGRTDNRDVEKLAADIFRGSTVQCVFLNACQSARAAVAGLAQHLVNVGVPHVLGWSASVGDDRATDFATEFYRRLVRGEALGAATAHAREHIRRAGLITSGIETVQDATYALPQLYAAVAHDEVVDRAAAPEPYQGPRTERYLLGDGIKGLKTGYVGRRREGQRLVPALRDGDKTFAVLTGIGGAGKSTLATRAANRLADDGFRVVPVRVDEGPDPATQGRAATLKLFTALATAFDLEKRPDAAAVLRDGQKAAKQRFELAAALLNEVRFLLVLDNLEPALLVETREIADSDFGAGLRALATDVTRGSRVLVTCRYLPANLPMEQANVLHIPLSDFLAHDVLKFLRREHRVDQRLNSGELPLALVSRLYADFGGTPDFLEQVRTLLADPKLNLNALRDELEGLEPGMLAVKRQAYYEKIVTSRLYAALSSEAQRVAARLALSILPLPVDAVAALTDLDQENARRCLDSGVEYGLLQRFDAPDLLSLFQPPGLLRAWLTDVERLPADDTVETHRRLAAFWQDAFKRDREAELRVNPGLKLEACRYHARLGADSERWCWAALQLARRLSRVAEWRRAYELIEEIPELQRDDACWHLLASIDLNEGNYAAAREKFGKALSMQQAIGEKVGEAATWHQLATIDSEEGNYAAARENFGKSLKMRQGIGDKAGEAATWHNLASVDLIEGNYAAAREKFGKSLNMRQAIGNKAGEASTFYQLGFLADGLRRTAEAAPLVAVCLLIHRSIGHAREDKDFKSLSAVCAKLGYDQTALNAMLQRTRESYQKDRGRALLTAAFPDWSD